MSDHADPIRYALDWFDTEELAGNETWADAKADALAALAALEDALRDLHAEVEMAESIGICLPDRVPSLNAADVLAALPASAERQET